MGRMLTRAALLVGLLSACAPAADDANAPVAGWVGYGGPGGSRVYPGPAPTRFDHTTGEGVEWETPLPSWGHGSPIAVAGKVFVLCETGPENVFPLLVCLDGATGKVLWQREVDHLPAIPLDDARQAALRERLRAYFDRGAELTRAYAATKGKDAVPLKDKAFAAETKALRQEMGLLRDPYHVQRSCHSYSCIGEAYATPVSDGTHVYVATAWGGYACYELDGRLRWLAWSPGHENTWNNRAPSPILHGELLLHSSCGRHRAFDRETGELLWERVEPFTSIATPAVITVGGRDVLLTPAGSAYRLPDGERLDVEGWRDVGMQILVKYDEPDVAFFCGSGEHCTWHAKGGGEPPNPPAALRFSLEGDTLRAKVLWHGGQLEGGKKVLGGNAPWMLYHDGRLYHREGFMLDALTGRVLDLPKREKYKPAGVPKTEHLLAVAGQHVYGLHRGIGWPTSKKYEALKDGKPTATLQVMTLDGRWVADNVLVRKPPTPEQRAVHAYCTGDPEIWMSGRKPFFSYGWTFTFGDGRLYIRSLDSLICIGP